VRVCCDAQGQVGAEMGVVTRGNAGRVRRAITMSQLLDVGTGTHGRNASRTGTLPKLVKVARPYRV
jgi:hypothetical protein